MTDRPIPIRKGVIPELDLEREMIDYLQKEMRLFGDDAGVPATRIAIAISGKGKNGTSTRVAIAGTRRKKSPRLSIVVLP